MQYVLTQAGGGVGQQHHVFPLVVAVGTVVLKSGRGGRFQLLKRKSYWGQRWRVKQMFLRSQQTATFSHRLEPQRIKKQIKSFQQSRVQLSAQSFRSKPGVAHHFLDRRVWVVVGRGWQVEFRATIDLLNEYIDGKSVLQIDGKIWGCTERGCGGGGVWWIQLDSFGCGTGPEGGGESRQQSFRGWVVVDGTSMFEDLAVQEATHDAVDCMNCCARVLCKRWNKHTSVEKWTSKC